MVGWTSSSWLAPGKSVDQQPEPRGDSGHGVADGDGLWPTRLGGLDASRGIAALAVVLWHWKHFAFEGSVLDANFDSTVQPFYPVLKYFYHLGWMGVDYFFVLSGFIFFWIYRRAIEEQRVGLWSFAVRRLARLYPLHLATLVAVALMQQAHHARTGGYFVFAVNDAYHFVLNLFLAQSWGLEAGWSFNAPVWSVSVEVLLYAGFFFVASRNRGGPVTCLLISGAALVASANNIGHGTGPVSLFFLGGAVYYLARRLTVDQAGWRTAVYAVCATSWTLTLTNAYLFKFALPLHTTLFGEFVQQHFATHILFPATVATIALIEIHRPGLWGRAAWLGDISYSSYLLHFPLQLALGIAVGYGILGGDFYQDPRALLAFLLALVYLSHVTFHRFERPIQRWLRARFGADRRALERRPHARASGS